MGRKLDQLIQSVRQQKGPFFMARLCLRLDFDINPGAVADSDSREKEIILACRMLGYEVTVDEPKR